MRSCGRNSLELVRLSLPHGKSRNRRSKVLRLSKELAWCKLNSTHDKWLCWFMSTLWREVLLLVGGFERE